MKLKPLLLLTIFGLIASCGTSQKKMDVPELITKRFAALYPDQKKVNWEMENGNFEAEFEQAGKEMTVIFEADGSVQQTETEADITALPQRINDYVKQNLSGQKITEACRIVDALGGFTWEIEVSQDDYVFSGDGSFIGKEAPEPGDEKDDDQ